MGAMKVAGISPLPCCPLTTWGRDIEVRGKAMDVAADTIAGQGDTKHPQHWNRTLGGSWESRHVRTCLKKKERLYQLLNISHPCKYCYQHHSVSALP